jgi:hypothetical protein
MTDTFDDRKIPHTDFNKIQKIFDGLVQVGIKKDQEYGASWCRRLGPGAFFTIWRKIDRLETQCELRKYDVFNVDEDVNSTESLDETLKDAIFYFGLLLEKRQAKREALVMQEAINAVRITGVGARPQAVNAPTQEPVEVPADPQGIPATGDIQEYTNQVSPN